jgi:hypothetical protein
MKNLNKTLLAVMVVLSTACGSDPAPAPAAPTPPVDNTVYPGGTTPNAQAVSLGAITGTWKGPLHIDDDVQKQDIYQFQNGMVLITRECSYKNKIYRPSTSVPAAPEGSAGTAIRTFARGYSYMGIGIFSQRSCTAEFAQGVWSFEIAPDGLSVTLTGPSRTLILTK